MNADFDPPSHSARSSPTATLVATTAEARSALGNKSSVHIISFPFKIGRESRSPNPLTRLVDTIERRAGTVPQLNDLYLREPASDRFQISREHCMIDYDGSTFFVVDRGSVCGSSVIAFESGAAARTVRTTPAGGHRRGGYSEVRHGDLIVFGNHDSPYVFRFQIA